MRLLGMEVKQVKNISYTLIMKLLKKIGKKFKSKSVENTHPKDVRLEQKLSESALVEIELRDR